MESALRPREIQTRIRAGESVEDVARAAGVPVERIEPYAGPVLAEREHVAAQAQRGSVRRRGETTGHRVLRSAVEERLAGRGVDPETVRWDSARMEDGRWSVSAGYSSGEADREALFYFDLKGRFSVAGNDEARWLVGEHSAAHGPQPGRRSPVRGDGAPGDGSDGEPTLDLNDELAIVRAIQEPRPEDLSPDDVVDSDVSDVSGAGERGNVTSSGTDASGAAADQAGGDVESTVVRLVPKMSRTREAVDQQTEIGRTDEFSTDDQADFSERAPIDLPEADDQDDSESVDELDDASELDLLFDMLGGEGYSEDSGRVYPGLATAGPPGGWEPAVVVDYPLGPEPGDGEPRGTEREQPAEAEVALYASDDTSQEEQADQPVPTERSDRTEDAVSEPDEPEELELPLEDEGSTTELPPAPGSRTENDASMEDAVPESAAAPASAAAAGSTSAGAPNDEARDRPAKKATPKKRKRAEVPSWDEIMFGGPKRD